MIKFLTFFFLISMSTHSFSKGSRKLLHVTEPIFKGIQPNTFYKKQTLKLAQQMLWEHKGYQPVFVDSGVDDLYRIDLVISRDKNINSLNFEIKDRNDRLVAKAWALDIQKRFLLLQIRLSLHELIFGKMKTIELAKVLLKKNTVNGQKVQDESGDDEVGAKLTGKKKDEQSEKGLGSDIRTKLRGLAARTSLEFDGGAEENLLELKRQKRTPKKKVNAQKNSTRI